MLVILSVNYIDRDGHTAQHRYCFPTESATTFVALSSFAESIILAVLSLSDARVKSYFYSIFVGNGPGLLPALGSSVYRRGVFIFLANNNELATIEIPAIKASLMDVTGKWAGIRICEQRPTVQDAFWLYFMQGYSIVDKGGRVLLPGGFELAGRTS